MREEARTINGTWIGGEFSISRKLQIAESLKEAIDGNETAKGIGKSTADKMVLNKFLTNQMDRERNKEQDRKNKELKDQLKKTDPEKLKKAESLLGFSISELIK